MLAVHLEDGAGSDIEDSLAKRARRRDFASILTRRWVEDTDMSTERAAQHTSGAVNHDRAKVEQDGRDSEREAGDSEERDGRLSHSGGGVRRLGRRW